MLRWLTPKQESRDYVYVVAGLQRYIETSAGSSTVHLQICLECRLEHAELTGGPAAGASMPLAFACLDTPFNLSESTKPKAAQNSTFRSKLARRKRRNVVVIPDPSPAI